MNDADTQRDRAVAYLSVRYARLVSYVVRRYGRPRRDMDADDYRTEALLGLAKARDTFDPSKGVPFSCHAILLMSHAVVDAGNRGRRPDNHMSLTDVADDAEAVEQTQHQETREEEALSLLLPSMPGNEGKLLRLMYNDGMSIKDAGAYLGYTARQAQYLYARAIKRAKRMASRMRTDGLL